MADEESAWFRANPEPQTEPQISAPNSSKLSLWNYPIGRSELAAPHEAALRLFADLRARLGPASSTADFSILGHASASGEAAGNERLATARAQNVRRYLVGLGFSEKLVVADGAGSASPADPARTGQAYARNRRVDVTVREAAPFDDDTAPVGKTPAASHGTELPVSPFVKFSFVKKLPAMTAPNLIIEVTLEVSGKAKVPGAKGAVEAGVAFKNFSPSPEFEKRLVDDLAVKVGINPPTDGKLPTASLGVKDKLFSVPLEIGIQSPSDVLKPTIVYFSVSLPKFAPIEMNFKGTPVSIDFDTFKIKCAVGPGPAMVRSMARFAVSAGSSIAAAAASPAAATAATLGGALVVAFVVIGGTIYLSVEAGHEGVAFANRLAARDGAASRAAREVLGAESLAAFNERKNEWLKIGGTAADTAFLAGAANVQGFLDGLLTPTSDERIAKRAAWVETYAKGANALDFTLVRERMFLRLGAYDKAETDLRAAVTSL